jgi:hypothetical protein
LKEHLAALSRVDQDTFVYGADPIKADSAEQSALFLAAANAAVAAEGDATRESEAFMRLADLHFSVGRPRRAAGFARKSLAIREARFGRGSRPAIESRSMLSLYLGAFGHWDEVEAIHRACLEDEPGARDEQRFQAFVWLGISRLNLHHPADAKDLLSEGIAIAEELGLRNPDVNAARAYLQQANDAIR